MIALHAVQLPEQYPHHVMAYTPAVQTAKRAQTPLFWGVGTGGLISEKFLRFRSGYDTPTIQVAVGRSVAPAVPPFVQIMQDVQAGFGRTLSRLPEVFGVSRQTLYNWMNGETPKPGHHEKLRELAAAARVFSELQFKPTSLALERTVAQGKTLLQLLSEGADGAESARRFVRVMVRGSEERSRLDALLGPRSAPKLEASDMGGPATPEG